MTNIDREHLDHYADLEAIKAAFLSFIDRVPFYGLAVLCLDNDHVQDIIPLIKKRYVTYGMAPQADIQAKKVSFTGLNSEFAVSFRGEELGRINLSLPGMHNVYNAMASIAVGIELNMSFHLIK